MHVHTHAHTYMHVHKHMYIHAHTHTDMHTYRHTKVLTCDSVCIQAQWTVRSVSTICLHIGGIFTAGFPHSVSTIWCNSFIYHLWPLTWRPHISHCVLTESIRQALPPSVVMWLVSQPWRKQRILALCFISPCRFVLKQSDSPEAKHTRFSPFTLSDRCTSKGSRWVAKPTCRWSLIGR